MTIVKDWILDLLIAIAAIIGFFVILDWILGKPQAPQLQQVVSQQAQKIEQQEQQLDQLTGEKSQLQEKLRWWSLALEFLARCLARLIAEYPKSVSSHPPFAIAA